MRRSSDVARVSLEDVTEAALVGVRRALAARTRPHDRLPFPILVGVIAYPDGDGLPVPFPQPEQEPIPLSAPDHTVILESVVRNAVPLLRSLGLMRDRNADFTSEDVLRALMMIEPDRKRRDLIEIVLDWLKKLERADTRPSSEARDVIKRVESAEALDEKIAILEKAQAEAEDDDQALPIGAGTAAAILRRGKDTIYNPAFYTEVLGPAEGGEAIARSAAGSVATEDVKGAVGGAAGGGTVGAAGGPGGVVAGATAGAVAGAVGGSVAECVSQLLDWIF